MAKRFIDTNFFKHPFVRGLQGASKGLYLYIICDCSNAGIWTLDIEIAQIFLGQKLSFEQFKTDFVATGKAVKIDETRFFFPDFIEFQYPQGLQRNNKAHTKIIEELSKFKLINNDLSIKKEGGSKGLGSPSQGSKEEEEDKEVVKDKEGGAGGNQPKPPKPPKPKKEKSEQFTKPTATECELEAQKIGMPPDEGIKFWNYYESKGWTVGKSQSPMKSWKAALQNWKSNYEEFKPVQKGNSGPGYSKPDPYDRANEIAAATIRSIYEQHNGKTGS
jgi:hypothetical protein